MSYAMKSTKPFDNGGGLLFNYKEGGDQNDQPKKQKGDKKVTHIGSNKMLVK